MLIEDGIIPYVARIPNRINLRGLRFHPLYWDPKSLRLSVRNNFKEGRILAVVQVLTALGGFISLFNFKSIPYKAIQGFFSVCLLVFSLSNRFFIKYSKQFTTFFNGLLDFENKYGKDLTQRENSAKLKTDGSKVLKILCLFQYHTLAPLTAILAITSVLAPDSPFNSFSILYRPLEGISNPGISVALYVANRAFIFVANVALWYPSLPALNFMMTANTAVAYYALNLLPWTFYRLVLKSIGGQTNDLETVAKSYREFQVLCGLYNDIHQMLLTRPFAVSTMVSQIVYLFILVAYNTQEGILIPLFAGMVLMNDLIIDLFCYSQAGSVHHSSALVKEKLAGKLELRRNMWFRRYIKSCRSVGIGFFHGFITKLTPLNVELFCFNKAAMLLLVNS